MNRKAKTTYNLEQREYLIAAMAWPNELEFIPF
jgi:hypothetical protein